MIRFNVLYKKRSLPNQRGVTIAFAAILALISSVVILATVKIIKSLSQETVLLIHTDDLLRLAESGLNDAIGYLIHDPNPDDFNNSGNTKGTISGVNGEFENHVELKSLPGDTRNIFYIVTGATQTDKGAKMRYSTQLHSYVLISNAGDYFAAVKESLGVSHGINCSQGNIYSKSLYFETSGGAGPTTLLKAQYLNSLSPPQASWDAALKSNIQIGTYPPGEVPEHVATEVVFPKVRDADFAYYKELAKYSTGPDEYHDKVTVFTGDIFPPGYAGDQDPLDSYAYHQADNSQHVYYSDHEIRLEGTIHGQILFVSTENIIITGDLIRAGENPASGDTTEDFGNLPGAGFPEASTANQAILITKKNVVIDNTFYTAGISTQQIRAFIIAPLGSLAPTSYGQTQAEMDVIHNNLRLNFVGSMILDNLSTKPDLAEVFGRNAAGARTYSYMNTLKTHPPPYIPALAEIQFSLEGPVNYQRL